MGAKHTGYLRQIPVIGVPAYRSLIKPDIFRRISWRQGLLRRLKDR